jgi:hypothetical protein
MAVHGCSLLVCYNACSWQQQIDAAHINGIVIHQMIARAAKDVAR